jgi:hypothetical protein
MKSKQPTDKPNVFLGKTMDNFRVWQKSANIYIWNEMKKLTIHVDVIEGLES